MSDPVASAIEHEIEVKRAMLLIQTLDPNAHIGFSDITGQWYVSAHIEIGGDGFLSGGTEHRDTPEDAVRAYLAHLTSIDLGRYLVTKFDGQRRHWRWNGAAFREEYVRD